MYVSPGYIQVHKHMKKEKQTENNLYTLWWARMKHYSDFQYFPCSANISQVQ